MGFLAPVTYKDKKTLKPWGQESSQKTHVHTRHS